MSTPCSTGFTMVSCSLAYWLGLVTGSSTVIAVIILIGTFVCIARAVFDPLRNLPGPFLARFSRFWYLKHVNKGQQHVEEVKLHKKYGPIVRIAPGQYSFSDISAARTIYDHGAKFPKSDFYQPFGVPNRAYANIFQDQNIETHAANRRRIASLYSMTSIVSYEPFVDSCMQTLFSKLDFFAKDSQSFDLPTWTQFYAFDVIGAISVGEPFGFLTHGYDFPGIIAEQRLSQTLGTHLGTFAGSWHQSLANVMSRIGKRPPFQATGNYTETNLRKKQLDMEEGKTTRDTTGKEDFVEKLLSLKARGKVTDTDLSGALRANIAAGSDTTGISLAAILYLLLRNPSTLAKLKHEIDEHKATQADSNQFITFAAVQNMSYLQATIKEALRLHPAIGMQLPRVVPEGGATLAGQFFPAGSVVGLNPWVIHRQSDLFGTDADQFRPERWLEDDQKAREMDRCLFTFGAGSRTCIGKNITMLEIQKLIPELVARYEFELADESAEWESMNRFFVYEKFACLVRRRSTTMTT